MAESIVPKFRTVQAEGKRQVEREFEFYNLDAIISVGYRAIPDKLHNLEYRLPKH